jgi:hypothetical protein
VSLVGVVWSFAETAAMTLQRSEQIIFFGLKSSYELPDIAIAHVSAIGVRSFGSIEIS